MTDWGGIAQVLTASGVLLTAALSGLATVLAAKAKKQAIETHDAVNSRMDEFKELFEARFRMEGAADEKDAQMQRDTVLAATVAATAPTLAAPVPVQVVGPGVDTPLKVTDAKPKRKRKK